MTGGKLSVADVNAMTRQQFIDAFGGTAEHSPWVAEIAAAFRPFTSTEDMIEAFANAVTTADPDSRLDLLNAHPDLAGRAAIAGDIGADSRSEQAGAGLDWLTAEEFAQFTERNTAYKDKFGFPFILAVRGATKHDIMAAFDARIGNDRTTELATAIAQVCRIIRFRLEDRIG